MSQTSMRPEMSTADRRDLARNLGVEETAETPVTWDGLATTLNTKTDPEFVSRGREIRDAFSDSLDGELLQRERNALEDEIARLPEVRAAGVPDEPEGLYEAVAQPGWRLYDHLVETGFFEGIEKFLPKFTPEHVEYTARELLLSTSLSTGLDELGFDEEEKTVLLASIVNTNERLARWVPSNQIPKDVEFDTENVPPLHQRTSGGALLWIRGLDRHLWQNRVIVTDSILDDANWHTAAMLGGLYVTATAACDIAAPDDERELSDGQLPAALTAGAAIQIVSQEELMRDVFYITDDVRAASKLR
ncbi:hypothetical protein [Halostagnicola bangensis]